MQHRLATVLVLTSLAFTAPACKTASSFDAITSPGVAVPLSAKFERKYMPYVQPGLEGRAVAFRLEPGHEPLGRASTDELGIATVQWTPPRAGTFEYTAQLVGTELAVAGRITAIAADRKVLIFDIDRTLSNQSVALLPLTSDGGDAFEGAPALLRELARDYEIIYLTARDDIFDSQTHAFLRKHDFPRGTVIFNEYGRKDPALGSQYSKTNHGKFKKAAIKKLQKRGLQIVAGFGDTRTDGNAYVETGLHAYLRGTGQRGNTTFYRTYEELRTLLIDDKLLRVARMDRAQERAP